MTERDRVFRDPRNQIVDFVFDDTVAEVFGDMIRRSVPGYETIIPITGLTAARHIDKLTGNSKTVYDLGCSLGATTLALLRQLGDAPASIIAVDSSIAMIERARTLVIDERVSFVHQDIRELELQPAGAVVLNFVLQFITPDERAALLKRIHTALAPDGLLVVSEKLRFEDPAEQAFYDEAHLDFKRANGYSDLEISQKRTALENVMIIDSEEQHRERFAEAGFRRTRKWFQCLNWVSFLVYP
ncbi:MAG: carboxy-S-adenosyl-L-methionine synthase CmoA [Gammaproteobacteria bacterium]|nr:carboxy-S-adenosyl-L-methionine synthase CmoA [Gammaproteobacteria bacterium]